MGAAKISLMENEMAGTVPRHDFPKIKSAAALPPREQTEEAKRPVSSKSPVFVWWLWAPFFAQLVLFLLGVGVYYATTKAGEGIKSNSKVLAEAPPDAPSSGTSRTHKREAGKSGTPSPNRLFVATFDQGKLQTNLGTPITVQESRDRGAAFKVSIDSKQRYGTEGGALRMDFEFPARAKKSAWVDIELPGFNLQEFKELSFYLRSDSSESSIPGFKVQMVTEEGVAATFDIDSVFTFWKSYRFRWREAVGDNPNFSIRSIRFFMEPNGGDTRGVLYLDHIALE